MSPLPSGVAVLFVRLPESYPPPSREAGGVVIYRYRGPSFRDGPTPNRRDPYYYTRDNAFKGVPEVLHTWWSMGLFIPVSRNAQFVVMFCYIIWYWHWATPKTQKHILCTHKFINFGCVGGVRVCTNRRFIRRTAPDVIVVYRHKCTSSPTDPTKKILSAEIFFDLCDQPVAPIRRPTPFSVRPPSTFSRSSCRPPSHPAFRTSTWLILPTQTMSWHLYIAKPAVPSCHQLPLPPCPNAVMLMDTVMHLHQGKTQTMPAFSRSLLPRAGYRLLLVQISPLRLIFIRQRHPGAAWILCEVCRKETIPLEKRAEVAPGVGPRLRNKK